MNNRRILHLLGIGTLLLVVGLVTPSRTRGYFPGGGADAGKGNDCLIGYDFVGPGQVTNAGTKKQAFVCVDCDPSCDLDGVATPNGSCTMAVGICIDQSGVTGCTPAGGLDKASAKGKVKGVKGAAGKIVIDASQLLQGSACGAMVEVVMPLKSTKKGLQERKALIKLAALVKRNKSAGIFKRKDKDKLTYICQPRSEGEACPIPTTTVTMPSSTSSTVESTTTSTAPAASTTTSMVMSSTTSTTTIPTVACGTFITKWGSFGSGEGQFDGPRLLAVDAAGNVFVPDADNDRIQKFTGDGTFLTMWGGSGPAAGQFLDPEGVAVDGAGNVFVADTGADRIQKFTNTGTFLTTWGSSGTADGEFSGPVAVAVDANGNVFVADRFNNRIQKFTNTGTFVTTWGSVGTADGQFGNPVGVAVDGSLNVFVVDHFNDRIQKFTNTGAFLTKWGSLGLGAGEFSDAESVAVDAAGNVFVADVDRIEKFTNVGAFVTEWGSLGNQDGQFNSVSGVAAGPEGSIFVSDFNHRVQKFACP
jgi:hypothetical protein